MKIAIVSPQITSHFEPEKYSSSQQVSLARELVKLGCHIDIYTGSLSGKLLVKTINPDFKLYYLPIIFGFHGQFILKDLASNLKREKYDIIQSSEDCQLTTLQLAYFCNKGRIPLIIYQGLYRYPPNLIFALLLYLYRILCIPFIRRNTSAVVAKTTAAGKFIAKLGFKNSEFIPIGIDIETFTPRDKLTSRKLLSISPEAKVFLYVGSLTKRKGLMTILNSLSHMHKKGEDFLFTIIGTGPEKMRLQKVARKEKVENKISFVGKVENEKLPLYYSAADLFLFASLRESFGQVILESMACGCPVITTPIPAAHDIIEDGVNGIITSFKKNNMSDKILSLLSNKNKLREMGTKAQKTIQEKYTWAKIAERFLIICSELRRYGKITQT